MMTIELMKACYGTPSPSGHEEGMVGFLCGVLALMPGVEFEVDEELNILVTKHGPGGQGHFPLLVAHTDNVQPHRRINVQFDGVHFYGLQPGGTAADRAGIGADDKAGILVVLDLLMALPRVKAIFCSREEVGYMGASLAPAEFFDDVGYAIEFDCPGRRTVAVSCGNVLLFGRQSVLWEVAQPVLAAYDRTELQHHPFTDLTGLRERFRFECLNVAVGYYQMHSRFEFVRYQDWLEARNCGISLVTALGQESYEYHGTPYDGPVGRMNIDQPTSRPTDR